MRQHKSRLSRSKLRALSRQANVGASSSSSSSSPSSIESMSAKDIPAALDEAEQALAEFELERAARLCQAAVQVDRQCCEAMDLLGQVLVEMGEREKAKQVFVHSAKLKPDSSHAKWMYIGQLSEGQEAIQCFQKGIELLSKQLATLRAFHSQIDAERQKNQQEIEQIGRQISSAYCSMAEVYQVDIKNAENAAQVDQACDKLLQSAVGACAKNPEAFASLAGLRLSHGMADDALRYLTRALQLMHVRVGANNNNGKNGQNNTNGKNSQNNNNTSSLSNGNGNDNEAKSMDDGDDDDEEELMLRQHEAMADLSYEFKTNVGKMCIDLNLYDAGAQMFEACLADDDHFVATWYWAGVCHMNNNDPMTAEEYFQRAQQMLQQCPLESLNNAIIQRLQEVKQAAAAQRASIPDDDDDDDDDDDGNDGDGGDEAMQLD